MATLSKNDAGLPGQLGTHPNHTVRSFTISESFIQGSSAKAFYAGCAIAAKDGKLVTPDTASSVPVGIIARNDVVGDKYELPAQIKVLTLGDIWVKVGKTLTIKPFEKVYISATDVDGVAGTLTNTDNSTANAQLPGAMFLSENRGGLALITYTLTMPTA